MSEETYQMFCEDENEKLGERVPEIGFLLNEGFIEAVAKRGHTYVGAGHLSNRKLYAWDGRIVMVSKCDLPKGIWKIMFVDLPNDEETRSALMIDIGGI